MTWFPTRLQSCIIWATVLVSAHIWLGLSLGDWLPAVRQAVPGRAAQPAHRMAATPVVPASPGLEAGFWKPLSPDGWLIPAVPAIPAIERKVLWSESAWGLGAYLAPAVDYHLSGRTDWRARSWRARSRR